MGLSLRDVCTPHTFIYPHMFGCPPVCLNAPNTSVWSLVQVYVSKVYVHMMWGCGTSTHSVLSAWMMIC